MAILAAMADDMKRQVQRSGHAIRDLSGGLRLELEHDVGGWQLTLSRPATRPSPQEESVCLSVFEVPDEARRWVEEGGVEVVYTWGN